MEITVALRDLLIETAEVLSGAERRRFMANTLDKLQLGQREAAGPRYAPQGLSRETLGPDLRRCVLLARTQACGVPSAPSVRRHSRPGPGPTSDRPHLPNHRPVLSLIGPRGPQAAHRTPRLHRQAVTIGANHRRQAERPWLPSAHGRQEPPPKKLQETDAIFQNLTEVHRRAARAEDTLRLSCDAKAPVLIGPFSRGGK